MSEPKKASNFFWFRAVGASFAGTLDRERRSRTFVRILPLVAMWRGKHCQDQKTISKNNTPLAIQEIQSVGDDLTEEKRHAAAITRMVEFGQ
jgi:hypothetical protein